MDYLREVEKSLIDNDFDMVEFYSELLIQDVKDSIESQCSKNPQWWKVAIGLEDAPNCDKRKAIEILKSKGSKHVSR